MELSVAPSGTVRCLYGEEIDLAHLGKCSMKRASHVEPAGSVWFADLSPIGGPTLGPFGKRSLALTAEVEWIVDNVL